MRYSIVLLVVFVFLVPQKVHAQECLGLSPPVRGPIVARYTPVGSYGGHWGIDIGAGLLSVVSAAGPGVVSFSGLVASNNSISVDHGGGLKTSYSFLGERWKGAGVAVNTGSSLGASSVVHDVVSAIEAVHFSVRLDGRYVNPEPLLDCFPYDLSAGLRLLPADE